MGVSEDHPLLGQRVEMGRWDVGIFVKGLHIAVAQIISQHDYDVGAILRGSLVGDQLLA